MRLAGSPRTTGAGGNDFLRQSARPPAALNKWRSANTRRESDVLDSSVEPAEASLGERGLHRQRVDVVFCGGAHTEGHQREFKAVNSNVHIAPRRGRGGRNEKVNTPNQVTSEMILRRSRMYMKMAAFTAVDTISFHCCALSSAHETIHCCEKAVSASLPRRLSARKTRGCAEKRRRAGGKAGDE